MNIEYVVCHCENVQGGVRILESFRFDNVDDAVSFCRDQVEYTMSWWEVKVEW